MHISSGIEVLVSSPMTCRALPQTVDSTEINLPPLSHLRYKLIAYIILFPAKRIPTKSASCLVVYASFVNTTRRFNARAFAILHLARPRPVIVNRFVPVACDDDEVLSGKRHSAAACEFVLLAYRGNLSRGRACLFNFKDFTCQLQQMPKTLKPRVCLQRHCTRQVVH